MERVNLRNLAALPERVDIATLDLSFISVLKVLPAVAALMAPAGILVVLVKPQFEALRGQVGSGGVVRDAAVHADVLRRVTAGVEACGFAVRGTIESPLKGAKEGNTGAYLHPKGAAFACCRCEHSPSPVTYLTEFLLVADKVREPAVSAA